MIKELPKIAISIGDLNGIGIEIALKCHNEISKICQPIYCINNKMLTQASDLLKIKIPENFELFKTKGDFVNNSGVFYQYLSGDWTAECWFRTPSANAGYLSYPFGLHRSPTLYSYFEIGLINLRQLGTAFYLDML